MAGLNNLLSDTQQTTTTMPAWYDQAQQNIVSSGNTAAAAAPTLGQTTAQGAINTLQDPNNPFTQAQGTLQQISSGAANPWITDPTTGAVTPDTSTAMGGLFAAENQQLNQLMPNAVAPAQANAIGSGNFGSLRGQTAVDKAKGDAFSTLMAQQMQSALSNQQTGQQAASNLGTVGQQGINANMNVGLEQMNAPFQTIGNQASLLGTLQAPTTVQSQKQLAPLGQITALGNAVSGGTAGLNSLLSSLGVKNGLAGIPGLSSLFGSSGGATAIDTSQGVQGPSGSMLSYGSPVTGTGTGGGAGAGQVLGTDGKVYADPTYGNGSTSNTGTTDYTNPNIVPDPGVSNTTSDPTSPDFIG